jgi:hypothetical protein
MTDIGYTLTVIAELASHRASTRLFTSDDARAILAHIADLEARAAAATLLCATFEAERDAARGEVARLRAIVDMAQRVMADHGLLQSPDAIEAARAGEQP